MNAKYYIYWNLHKKCYSVKFRGKVIKHFRNAVVAVPEFRVSAAGRERVRREQKKTVHAYIVSNYVQEAFWPTTKKFSLKGWKLGKNSKGVTYNPYKNESFVDNDGNALYNAHEAYLSTVNGKPVIEIIG